MILLVALQNLFPQKFGIWMNLDFRHPIYKDEIYQYQFSILAKFQFGKAPAKD